MSGQVTETPKWARFVLAFTALVVGGAVTLNFGAIAMVSWLPCPPTGPCLHRSVIASLGITVLASLCLALTWLSIQGCLKDRMRLALATLLPLVALFLMLPLG